MEVNNLRFIIGIIALSSYFHRGSALYFVQLENSLPWGFFTRNGLVVEALLDPDDSGSVTYSISKPMNCPTLTINTAKGNVIYGGLTNQGEPPWDKLEKPCRYTVSANLQGQVGHRNMSLTSMNLTLSPDKDCSTASHSNQCFNGLEEVRFQVLENSKDKVKLGHFGEEMKRCGNNDVKYKVIIGQEEQNVLSIQSTHEDMYDLWAAAGLDREHKPMYEFKVECTLTPKNSVKAEGESMRIPGRLTILDENDNGPRTQDMTTSEPYDISFEPGGKNEYKPNSQIRPGNLTSLLVIDRDTVDVNRFRLNVVNDTWSLLNITHSVFKVDQNYSSTGIFLRIVLTEEAKTRKPWTGRYCVAAKLNDTTLLKGFGPSIMTYLICLHWGEPHTHAHGDNHDHPRPVSQDGAFCGRSCKLYLLVTGVTCFVTVIVMCICLRYRARQSKRRKCPLVKPNGLLGHGLINGEDYSENTNNATDLEYMSPNNRMAIGVNSLQDSDMYMLLDPKWEISRSALLLEQILGEGEFGKVLKGRLRGVEAPEGYTNVAVKMLKDNHVESGKSSRQEFMAEFVLLKQVDHPNVIKLIGACTSAGGPLYLIMEYAELGSLRSFLRKCRKIESLCTDNDDPSINPDLEASKYVVSPHEVLGFSWQIAKGMTYLSDMKMVHRDLAARNILVTQNKVCKISDFGLTRDIYVDDAYKKKSKDRVPVKWLAPECLADELYTTKSDVWSYGILLWELATLGASPYPGIPSEKVYSLLRSGYRMQQPPNCTFELYCLMRACWAAEPVNRPTFREIDITLAKLLEDGIEYLKLDIPMVSNPGYQYFNESQPISVGSDNTAPHNVATNAPFVSSLVDGAPQFGYTNVHHPYINYEETEDHRDEEESNRMEPVEVGHVYESPIKNCRPVVVNE